jgi:uncharacterized membrane protein
MPGGFIFNKKRFALGRVVPSSAIYTCSVCDNVTAFKKGETFGACEACTEKNDGQEWVRTNEVVHFVSKNLNVEYLKIETIGLKLADFIADYSGRISFIILHIIWFGFWIYVNTGRVLFGISGFDPYPFGLLTMIVSLEAIFLSTFILISQNRQGVKSELRADLDYQVNIKAEKEIAELESILRDIKEEQEKMRDELKTALMALPGRQSRSELRKRKRKQESDAIMHDADIEQIDEA